MGQTGFNPCDVCEDNECTMCAMRSKPNEYECSNHSCFLNYEGSCTICLYSDCGAWKKDGE